MAGPITNGAKPDHLIIGIDAGTSVIKAVAFDLAGRQIDSASTQNSYRSESSGAVTQSLLRTWEDCAATIRALGAKLPNLAKRTVSISVTAQGDGTWLVGKDNEPVSDAWLWLDARAAPTVERLASEPLNRARFEATGTGLNTCQQGSQLAHMDRHYPGLLNNAEVVLHCKDWIYLNLTGIRATDPSEASFTFGNFRNRKYDDMVIEALGLQRRRNLLPEIIDGTKTQNALTAQAAKETGLLAGTPVSLGYVDMAMTALGAGVHTGDPDAACSVIGSTGVHMRAVAPADVHLNQDGTGYVIALPVPDIVTQVQTNMAATLNLDWVLGLAGEVLHDFGHKSDHAALIKRVDEWLAAAKPGRLLYHPYISEAGERGPFVDANARADFIGLASHTRYADLIHAVVEGLALAMRDCYALMGPMPNELRVTGGAARSAALRKMLAAAVNAPIRVSSREEAGAAGTAMMAAVAIGAFSSMDQCIATWVKPLLGRAELPDKTMAARFAELLPIYQQARQSLKPIWRDLASIPLTPSVS